MMMKKKKQCIYYYDITNYSETKHGILIAILINMGKIISLTEALNVILENVNYVTWCSVSM
jgi:hypothetical protein